LEIANYPGRAMPLQLEDGIWNEFLSDDRIRTRRDWGFRQKKEKLPSLQEL
jgi:hypothetical protein